MTDVIIRKGKLDTAQPCVENTTWKHGDGAEEKLSEDQAEFGGKWPWPGASLDTRNWQKQEVSFPRAGEAWGPSGLQWGWRLHSGRRPVKWLSIGI